MFKKLSVKMKYSNGEIPKAVAELTEFFSDVKLEVSTASSMLTLNWRFRKPNNFVWFHIYTDQEKSEGFLGYYVNGKGNAPAFDEFIRIDEMLQCWTLGELKAMVIGLTKTVEFNDIIN